jgi:two-component system NarL family sensor kinase
VARIYALDDFDRAFAAFAGTPAYRNYRQQSLARPTLIQMGMDAASVTALSQRLRGALLSGDTQAADAAETGIRLAIFRWYRAGSQAWERSSRNFITLFLMLGAFITLLAGTLFAGIIALYHSREERAAARRATRTLLQGEENERHRIARELHDTVLIALRKIPGTKDVSDAIRGICVDLLPPDFANLRLTDALSSLTERFTARTGIPVAANFDEADSGAGPAGAALNGEALLHCYRVAQEALNNVEKHANANKVIVTVREQNGFLAICVSDDGAGLPPDKLWALRSPGLSQNSQGIGARSMRERVAMLGGTLGYLSEPGKGLMVCLKIPYTNSSAAEGKRRQTARMPM